MDQFTRLAGGLKNCTCVRLRLHGLLVGLKANRVGATTGQLSRKQLKGGRGGCWISNGGHQARGVGELPEGQEVEDFEKISTPTTSLSQTVSHCKADEQHGHSAICGLQMNGEEEKRKRKLLQEGWFL